MKPFIICSFYTPDYKEVFNTHLKPSLTRLGLEYYSKEYPNSGNWALNTRLKSKFAQHCLETFPDKDVIILDVDSRINTYPELFGCIPESYDIGLHILDQNQWYQNGSSRKELLTGTLYLPNKAFTKLIVNEWVYACDGSSDTDQVILERVLKTLNITPFQLPISYCYIVSLPDGRSPLVMVSTPVIEHFQHSRIVRKS